VALDVVDFRQGCKPQVYSSLISSESYMLVKRRTISGRSQLRMCGRVGRIGLLVAVVKGHTLFTSNPRHRRWA